MLNRTKQPGISIVRAELTISVMLGDYVTSLCFRCLIRWLWKCSNRSTEIRAVHGTMQVEALVSLEWILSYKVKTIDFLTLGGQGPCLGTLASFTFPAGGVCCGSWHRSPFRMQVLVSCDCWECCLLSWQLSPSPQMPWAKGNCQG